MRLPPIQKYLKQGAVNPEKPIQSRDFEEQSYLNLPSLIFNEYAELDTEYTPAKPCNRKVMKEASYLICQELLFNLSTSVLY